jgi:hypothetical protein
MIVNPLGKLFGDVPYDLRDATPANKGTPGVPQPPGTKALAQGEGYNSRDWNRPLAAIDHQVDAILGGLSSTGETDTFVHSFGIGAGSSLPDTRIPAATYWAGWAYVGASSSLAPKLALVTKDGELYLNDNGDPVYVDHFEDLSNATAGSFLPAALPGATDAVTAATKYSVTTATDFELTVLPGICLVKLSNTASELFDGYYRILDIRHEEIVLGHPYHRLTLDNVVSGQWNYGDLVSTTSDPTTVGTIIAVSVTGDWIQVLPVSPTTLHRLRLHCSSTPGPATPSS